MVAEPCCCEDCLEMIIGLVEDHYYDCEKCGHLVPINEVCDCDQIADEKEMM